MVRTKMSAQERAKQFMPFAALKGYPEALRQKENVVRPKADLSEEYQDELNRRFLQIKRGDVITVVYYCGHEYLKITGIADEVNKTSKILKVADAVIHFEDIYDIARDEKISFPQS